MTKKAMTFFALPEHGAVDSHFLYKKDYKRSIRVSNIPRDIFTPNCQQQLATLEAAISMKYTIPLVLASSAVHGWKISFHLGPSCTGQSLYSVVYDEGTECVELGEAAANAQSIIASATGPNDDDYVPLFFSTSDCSGKPISDPLETVCIPDQKDNIKSYEVRHKDNTRSLKGTPRRAPRGAKKRTPAQIEAELTRCVCRARA